jgi:hypothetical protein
MRSMRSMRGGFIPPQLAPRLRDVQPNTVCAALSCAQACVTSLLSSVALTRESWHGFVRTAHDSVYEVVCVYVLMLSFWCFVTIHAVIAGDSGNHCVVVPCTVTVTVTCTLFVYGHVVIMPSHAARIIGVSA